MGASNGARDVLYSYYPIQIRYMSFSIFLNSSRELCPGAGGGGTSPVWNKDHRQRKLKA